MLIRFSLENWMSFRDRATLSMIASRERQHGECIPRLSKYQTGILPVTAIFGPNASGKTGLFSALDFVRSLVVDGTSHSDEPIPVQPFLPDAPDGTRPTHFILELLIDEIIYEFRGSLNGRSVLEEQLTVITSTSEKVMYRRRKGKPNFHKSLARDRFLRFVFNSTRDNQLFLTHSVLLNADRFRPVYDWFKNTLRLISPDFLFTSPERFPASGNPLHETMNERLRELDIGIERLEVEDIPSERLSLSGQELARLQADAGESRLVRLQGSGRNLVLGSRDGMPYAGKLVAVRREADGTEIRRDLDRESSGVQRIAALLPAIIDLSSGDRKSAVHVIDDMDRSLHTLLTVDLVRQYLARCSDTTRSQLLFSAHDLLLMDQHLLRRDEMWVTERRDPGTGSSSLIAFSEYGDIRYDKDIRKSYLKGHLGGIPRPGSRHS
ncbi:MAG: ATP-binding protein [Gammaproteobacteria bacterium]|nr:ATP-binding protein [Gammaproteobacteria bacterium]